MNDETIVLPLFPTTGVILPYGSMTLLANEKPYIQLIQDCIENDSLFLSAYSGISCHLFRFKPATL
jgi:Lon protease-like protein